MSLRVAVDLRTLQRSPLHGVGRVTQSVLSRLPPEVEILGVGDVREPAATEGAELFAGNVRGWLPSYSGWLQTGVPRWLRGAGADVFHGPYYWLPLAARGPMVVTLHDLSFESHPEWFHRKVWIYRSQARFAARRAQRILTVSSFVAGTVVDRYGIDPSKIVVAPNGVDGRFRVLADDVREAALRCLGIRGPYLLAMGGKPRRRIDLALGAWRAVRDLGLQLVVLGQVLPEEKGLHCLGAIDDDELVALMGGASAFLYPTEFEGFGLPALEAAACGTVVVAHPSTSLPEVLPEDAAAWAEALEIDALAAVTRRVLTDDAWADALRERGLRRAAGATWDAAVSAHVRAYREASEA